MGVAERRRRPEAVSMPAPAEPAPELAVEGLSKGYPGVTQVVLREVGFRIHPGERVALLGANGSGKSTLLRCCLRLIEPDAGEIRLLGSDLRALPARRLQALRARIGFIFQRHNLVGRLSALSNVIHGALGHVRHPGLWLQGTAGRHWRERAWQCLEEVGLTECAARRADRLSGGQSQRVAIARTLMQRPRLVFADEPAASLDPAAGHEMMALFARLVRAHGMTLVFASHDLEHARLYADRIIALQGGRVVLDRPARAVDFQGLGGLYQREAG